MSSTTRREFLDRVATSAAMLGILPTSLAALAPVPAVSGTPQRGAEFDVTWPQRVTGKYRGVFDVPEVESGYGVWRASIWAKQYETSLGVPAADLSTVLILRHNAIVLAMQQPFWDEYGIGGLKDVKHPVTLETTDRNPALLSSSRGEVPAMYDDFALPRFLARGGIALACDLALRDCVALIQNTDRVDEATAHRKAVGLVVPGVLLQPSGVFAAALAQHKAGCAYVRAA
ncbi:MAG TPA: hypothetical protein VFG84_12060 [Gemmatimonadaceae bacterium]|nr:hypothetical protein [Gemmatimonadaceae bacterium]